MNASQYSIFRAWFDAWADPNVGWVETHIKRIAAWAAWQKSREVAMAECRDSIRALREQLGSS
ncbi:hypothetical protein PUN4_50001 [Paraburkholderia unamae]|uniref:hypothetical protein n=1 Tax=Paraburkholderia unamae TaxID=219649 RepID=UPI001CABD86D|nr:hypothetical protein [Paraburkholderia unamae]CAG9265109.1 hypothetical protein PUN4_50001 [Paraburkholderia unamae]